MSDLKNSFTTNKVIEWFRHTIRFGHGNNASKFFSRESSELYDYTNGVIIMPIILLVILAVLLAMIVTFRRLGFRNVGFLSGHRLVQQPKDIAEYTYFNRFRLVRWFFTLFALTALVFCGISVTKGSIHFDNMILSLQTSVLAAEDLVADSIDIFDQLIIAGNNAQGLRVKTEEAFTYFCPGEDKIAIFGVDFNVDKISDSLEDVADFIVDRGSSTRVQIQTFHDVLVTTDKAFTPTSTLQGSIAYIVLPVSFLCTLLIAGCMLASFGYSSPKLEWMQTRIVMPLLLFVSLIFWFSASVFCLIGIVNADTCLGGEDPGSPDGTRFDILSSYKDKQPVLYDTIRYYIDGCSTQDPFLFIEEYLVLLDEAMAALKKNLDSVDDVGTDVISVRCGHDVTEEVMIMRNLEDLLKKIDIQADRSMEVIDCPRIHAIYIEALHKGACTNLPLANFWIFISLLVIGMCGMIMITLRSAWLEMEFYVRVDDLQPDDDSSHNIETLFGRKHQ